MDRRNWRKLYNNISFRHTSYAGGYNQSKLFKAHIMLKHLIEMINHLSISIIILLRKKTCEKVYTCMVIEKTMDFQYRISFFRSPFMYDFWSSYGNCVPKA